MIIAMSLTAEQQLPDDVDALKQLELSYQGKATHQQRIHYLEEQLRLLLQKRFGARSEQKPIDQLAMLNEAECPETGEAADEEDSVAVTPHMHVVKSRGCHI